MFCFFITHAFSFTIAYIIVFSTDTFTVTLSFAFTDTDTVRDIFIIAVTLIVTVARASVS